MRNKYAKNIYWVITWFAIGIVLTVLSRMGVLDSYWNGAGSGLVAVAVIQLIRQMRYRSDDEYREKVDVEINDERNKYISTKAWAWAGYLFVLIMAVGVIASKALGYDEMSMYASWSLCILLVLYWGSYWVLRKKY